MLSPRATSRGEEQFNRPFCVSYGGDVRANVSIRMYLILSQDSFFFNNMSYYVPVFTYSIMDMYRMI